MTSGNVNVGTIKSHGLAVGDRFMFHGLASDPLPTVEGTRVEIGKVGAKYMLTTVTGDVHTWEFGASAKVWADTTVTHHVTTEARTLDNGDTVYVGRCEHDWMTGYHVTEADAEAVAGGHGEVSRPLYVAPSVEDTGGSLADEKANPFWSSAPLAVGDTVVTSDGVVGMVETVHASGMVSVFGIVECAKIGDFYPIALTIITEDMTRSAQQTIKTNGRVFVAEAANFGVPAQTWPVLVAHGWATLVNDGDMSRWVRTRRTVDRVTITDGLAVWDYNLTPGRVIMSTMDGEGWFNVYTINGDRSLMNGERVITRHPSTGQSAAEALAAAEALDTDACEIHPGGYNIPGTAVCVGCEADGTHTMDGPVVDIPTEAETTAMIAEHDAAMSAWVAPLVKALTVPTEAEVWTGTGTVVKPRRCNRLHSGRRCDRVTSADRCPCTVLTIRPTVKHKRTKVNARRVRGGF